MSALMSLAVTLDEGSSAARKELSIMTEYGSNERDPSSLHGPTLVLDLTTAAPRSKAVCLAYCCALLLSAFEAVSVAASFMKSLTSLFTAFLMGLVMTDTTARDGKILDLSRVNHAMR